MPQTRLVEAVVKIFQKKKLLEGPPQKTAITFFLGNLRTVPYALLICSGELYLMQYRIFELVDSKWPKSKKAQKRHLEGSNRPENRRI